MKMKKSLCVAVASLCVAGSTIAADVQGNNVAEIKEISNVTNGLNLVAIPMSGLSANNADIATKLEAALPAAWMNTSDEAYIWNTTSSNWSKYAITDGAWTADSSVNGSGIPITTETDGIKASQVIWVKLASTTQDTLKVAGQTIGTEVETIDFNGKTAGNYLCGFTKDISDLKTALQNLPNGTKVVVPVIGTYKNYTVTTDGETIQWRTHSTADGFHSEMPIVTSDVAIKTGTGFWVVIPTV